MYQSDVKAIPSSSLGYPSAVSLNSQSAASGDFAPFTETELADNLVAVDSQMSYPVVVTDQNVSVGQKVAIPGVYAVAGRVTRVTNRGNRSLLQVQPIPVTEIYSSINYKGTEVQGTPITVQSSRVRALDASTVEVAGFKCKTEGSLTALQLSLSGTKFQFNPYAEPSELLIERGTLVKARMVMGIRLSISVKPAVSGSAGVVVQYKCEGPPLEERIPITGPFSALLAAKTNAFPSFEVEAKTEGGVRFEASAEFKLENVFTFGFEYSNGELKGVGASSGAGSTFKPALKFDVPDEQLPSGAVQASVGNFFNLNAGLEAVPAAAVALEASGLGAFQSKLVQAVLDGLYLDLIKSKVGTKAIITYWTAKRVLNDGKSDSLVPLVGVGEVKLESKWLNNLAAKVFSNNGGKKLFEIKLLSLEASALSLYQVPKEGDINAFVNGTAVNKIPGTGKNGIPTQFGFKPKSSVKITLSPKFDAGYDTSVNDIEVYFDGQPFTEAKIVSSQSFEFGTDDLTCEKLATGKKIQVLAYNKMFGILRTPGLAATFTARCVDEPQPPPSSGCDTGDGVTGDKCFDSIPPETVLCAGAGSGSKNEPFPEEYARINQQGDGCGTKTKQASPGKSLILVKIDPTISSRCLVALNRELLTAKNYGTYTQYTGSFGNFSTFLDWDFTANSQPSIINLQHTNRTYLELVPQPGSAGAIYRGYWKLVEIPEGSLLQFLGERQCG